MSATARIVLVTCPGRETAIPLARALVSESLAACVNVAPGIESIYRWNGEIEQAREVLLIIKTDESHLAALEARVFELHPYETPEFVAFAPDRVAPSYMQWITDCLG